MPPGLRESSSGPGTGCCGVNATVVAGSPAGAFCSAGSCARVSRVHPGRPGTPGTTGSSDRTCTAVTMPNARPWPTGTTTPSPGTTFVAVPASSTVAGAAVNTCGADNRGSRMFQAGWAVTASTVSKVTAFSPGPGTLVTAVPIGIVTSGVAPASSMVKASEALAARPGSGW